jgi:hypothetical protein
MANPRDAHPLHDDDSRRSGGVVGKRIIENTMTRRSRFQAIASRDTGRPPSRLAS